MLRLCVKRTAQALALVFAFPLALLSSFGRIGFVHQFMAQLLALAPGAPGSFWRAAFYKLTLTDCSIDTVIAFGSFFSRRHVTVRPNVSIGSYCIIGQAEIGARTQISSHVEIPGGRQHSRDSAGQLSNSIDNPEDRTRIGADCWIGACAVILADVGEQSTIGAGSVVVKAIPPRVVAVGAPARPIKSSLAEDTHDVPVGHAVRNLAQ